MHLRDSPPRTIASETALLETDPKVIGEIKYKPSIEKDSEMTRHKEVESKDDHNIKFNWKTGAQLSDDYKKYHAQFLNMLDTIQSM